MSEQPGSLYRSEALRRFNSPEQLDQRINLIPPAMRVMAASMTVIVAASLIWAVLGSVPTRVTGHGVLMADGKASHTVQPVISGLVMEVLVSRGDHVEVDTPIARIQQVSLDTQLASTATRVAALQHDLAQLKKAQAAELAKIDAILRRQTAAAREQISASKVRAEGLKEILAAAEALFAKGMISRLEVANARGQYDQTLLDTANATAREVEIEAVADQKRDDFAEIDRQKQEDIDALQAEAARLRAEVTIGSVVKAPVAGTIEEIRVGIGDVVSPGTIIATIGRISPQSFEVIAVFSNDMSKRIAPGMDVHVIPASVKKEEHGSIRGRVLSITELGVSNVELNTILRNPQLTNSLMGDTSPLLAKVEVVVDKGTPSGFAWWGGPGPPYLVTHGTRVTVEVIVDRRTPIALIIPAFRNLLGLEG